MKLNSTKFLDMVNSTSGDKRCEVTREQLFKAFCEKRMVAVRDYDGDVPAIRLGVIELLELSEGSDGHTFQVDLDTEQFASFQVRCKREETPAEALDRIMTAKAEERFVVRANVAGMVEPKYLVLGEYGSLTYWTGLRTNATVMKIEKARELQDKLAKGDINSVDVMYRTVNLSSVSVEDIS